MRLGRPIRVAGVSVVTLVIPLLMKPPRQLLVGNCRLILFPEGSCIRVLRFLRIIRSPIEGRGPLHATFLFREEVVQTAHRLI